MCIRDRAQAVGALVARGSKECPVRPCRAGSPWPPKPWRRKPYPASFGGLKLRHRKTRRGRRVPPAPLNSETAGSGDPALQPTPLSRLRWERIGSLAFAATFGSARTPTLRSPVFAAAFFRLDLRRGTFDFRPSVWTASPRPLPAPPPKTARRSLLISAPAILILPRRSPPAAPSSPAAPIFSSWACRFPTLSPMD